MDIVISNILLTRRCPLKCDYCRISRDYDLSPYAKVKSYAELSAKDWIEAIKILENNGCVFHTIYGGEPVLYKELPKLVRLLNWNDAKYTFITSGHNKEKWLKIHKTCGGIKGISASVDVTPGTGDRAKKSCSGRLFLSEMKEAGVEDVVAVTVLDEQNIHTEGIFRLVEQLSEEGIVTEITLMDEPKSVWYDFAESTGLVIKSHKRFVEVMDRLKDMKNKGLRIHNNVEFFDQAKNYYRGDYYCKKPFTSMTIEPDGTLRLCYRIGGKGLRNVKVFDLEKKQKRVDELFENDRKELCMGCSWNCVMMSEFLANDKEYCKTTFQHNQ